MHQPVQRKANFEPRQPLFTMFFNLYFVTQSLISLIILSMHTISAAIPHIRRTGTQPALKGGPNTIGPGTYPRAVQLQNGDLVAVETTFPNGQHSLVTTVSTDGGNSWQPLGVITTGPGDIDNGYLLQLNSGRILCAFRNHDKNGETYIFFRITICCSDDNGVSWQYLSQPASDPGPVNGNWEPFLRLSLEESNDIQLYYSRENAADDQDSLLRTSTDGGVTWSTASTVSGEGITARDGMIGVANFPLGSNSLIAIFESQDTSPGGTSLFKVHSITSNDDGATWGQRSLVYAPTGIQTNAGAPQIIDIGGTLVVSKHSHKELIVLIRIGIIRDRRRYSRTKLAQWRRCEDHHES